MSGFESADKGNDLLERGSEGIKAGTLKLAGIEEQPIYELATELLTDPQAYEKMAGAVNPYGDGKVSQRIAEAIRFYFKQTDERPEEYKPL